MRVFRVVSAVICGLIGLVWLGQGLGLLRGSIMTGSPVWAIVGAVLVAIAVWQVLSLTRTRS